MTIPHGAIYRQKIVLFSVESHNLEVAGGVLLKGRFVRTLNVVGRLLGHGRPSTGNRYVQLDDAT